MIEITLKHTLHKRTPFLQVKCITKSVLFYFPEYKFYIHSTPNFRKFVYEPLTERAIINAYNHFFIMIISLQRNCKTITHLQELVCTICCLENSGKIWFVTSPLMLQLISVKFESTLDVPFIFIKEY